jgi:hypothetical protein
MVELVESPAQLVLEFAAAVGNVNGLRIKVSKRKEVN